MRYAPILALSLALLGVVVLMSGDTERGMRAAGQIALVVAGLLVLAALLALAAGRVLDL